MTLSKLITSPSIVLMEMTSRKMGSGNYRLTPGYDHLIQKFWKKKKRLVLSLSCAKGEIRVHQDGKENMHYSDLQWWQPQ